jgi:hypothetical protein
MAVGFIKAINKGVLCGFAGLDELQFILFLYHQSVKIAEPSALPLSGQIAFGKSTISSNFSMTRTTRAPLANSDQPRWLKLPDWIH